MKLQDFDFIGIYNFFGNTHFAASADDREDDILLRS